MFVFCDNPASSADKHDKIKNTVVSDLAVGLRGDSHLKSDKVKHGSPAHGSPSPNNQNFSRLQRRLLHQKLVIVKVDKCETLIILFQANYEKKILDFLTKSQNHSKFNLENYNKEIGYA